MVNYLVTGGAGFIGSHLVDKLLSLEGNNVTVIGRSVTGKRANYAHHSDDSRLEVYEADVTDDLKPIFSQGNFATVFHLAAITSVNYSNDHPAESEKVNYKGTVNLLEHSLNNAYVGRFVFSSSAAVEDPSSSKYAAQKANSEKACKIFNRKGLETISLRYFNVFGPRQSTEFGAAIPSFISKALNGETIKITGTGEQTRDFIYVDDVVDANLRAAFTDNLLCFGNAFNIGSGISMSLKDLASMVIGIIGGDSKVEYEGKSEGIKNSKAEINLSAFNLLWEPKTSFEQGLRKTIEWFKGKNL